MKYSKTIYVVSGAVFIVGMLLVYFNITSTSTVSENVNADASNSVNTNIEVSQPGETKILKEFQYGHKSNSMLSGITLDKGLLSIDVEKQSLRSVLNKISSLSGVEISTDIKLPEQYISISFNNLTVEDGVRRLAHPFDTLFLYSGVNLSDSLKSAWIFPQQHGSENIEKIKNYNITNKTDTSKYADPNKIVNENAEYTFELVMEKIQDADETIRGRALLAAGNNDIEISFATLGELVATDESPVVRSIALELLASNKNLKKPEFESIVKIAENDSNEIVRSQAKSILSQLQQQELNIVGQHD